MSSTITRKDLKRRQPKTEMHKRLRYYYKGGRQLYRDVSYLKGLINTEFKWKDSIASTQVIGNTSATAQLFLLNGTSRGTDSSNRVGRTIRLKSIATNFTVRLNDACAAGTENVVRVILLWQKHVQGVAPTYSGTTSTSLYVSDTVDAMRYLNNRSDFRVLKEWKICLNADGVKARNIRYYRKLSHKVVYNNGTAGDVTDIETGALYLIALGTLNNANPDETWISHYSRIRYIDN